MTKAQLSAQILTMFADIQEATRHQQEQLTSLRAFCLATGMDPEFCGQFEDVVGPCPPSRVIEVLCDRVKQPEITTAELSASVEVLQARLDEEGSARAAMAVQFERLEAKLDRSSGTDSLSGNAASEPGDFTGPGGQGTAVNHLAEWYGTPAMPYGAARLVWEMARPT